MAGQQHFSQTWSSERFNLLAIPTDHTPAARLTKAALEGAKDVLSRRTLFSMPVRVCPPLAMAHSLMTIYAGPIPAAHHWHQVNGNANDARICHEVVDSAIIEMNMVGRWK